MDEITARLVVLTALLETLAAHTLSEWPQPRFNAFTDAVLDAFEPDARGGPEAARQARIADLADDTLARIRERRAILLRKRHGLDSEGC